ncbi:hypothetical protein [Thalassococcus sp. S3]|uniref:hypothetical protein n=1 Tax=Thalassococcus sp. S3 TaxID=2017482 RepID=UPI001024213E|nr:hypothetical protein [Thalassococcus sp. S3]QBF30736.1 hypothetical protein CFI11_05825 [Thalassococcus sp. S3]
MLRVIIAVSFLAGAAFAEEESGKFRVVGDRLIYDTENPGEEQERGIELDDPDILLDLLRANPGIRTLELNSGGGRYYSAFDMTNTVIDFELDTHVHGICESSCTLVFLAGKKRTMSRGSKIGFHQTFWTADSIEGFYEDKRADRGWETPFDFTSWVYKDTQDEIYNELTYMIRQGVDPAFAIETIKEPTSTMWYPYRPVLRAAGVLTAE